MLNTITVRNTSIMNAKMLNRFYSYLDVSAVTLRAYRSGVRQFIAYLNISNVQQPNRNTVLMFKKTLQLNGAKTSTVAMYLISRRA